MLLQLDKGLWVEVPDNASEEVKAAKIAKYKKDKEASLNKLVEECKTTFRNPSKVPVHQRKIGALYDKRVNLSSLLNYNK